MKLNKSKIFFHEIAFLVIFEIAKNRIGPKKIREIDLLFDLGIFF